MVSHLYTPVVKKTPAEKVKAKPSVSDIPEVEAEPQPSGLQEVTYKFEEVKPSG